MVILQIFLKFEFIMNLAFFRFYEELNDFLLPEQHKQTLPYTFNEHPGVKDPIEVFGVPHTEVELIIVNGESVGFDYQLQEGDRVAVYPVFDHTEHSLDITPLVRLRDKPLHRTAFIIDSNLGKLARYLRLMGFDTLYSNQYSDREVVETGVNEGRIILTRDRRLLHHKIITHGYFVRSVHPDEQVAEVLKRFDLANLIRPMHRCAVCNGEINSVDKKDVLDKLEPLTKKYYSEFYQCADCEKVYWKGSHYEKIIRKLNSLMSLKLAGS